MVYYIAQQNLVIDLGIQNNMHCKTSIKYDKRYMLKFIRQVALSILFVFSAFTGFSQQPAGTPNVDQAARQQKFNEHIGILLNAYKYDETIALINNELKNGEDPALYFYLSHVYAVKHVWDSSILFGEKAMKLNPNMAEIYPKLFYVYTQAGKLKEAESLVDKIKQADPKGTMNDQLTALDTSLANQNASRTFTFLLFLSLVAAFFIPAFNASKNQKADAQELNKLRFTETILIAGAISCVLWTVFYALSAKIWSTNPKHAAYEFTLMTRAYIYEHDGSETFVLYSMMLANVLLTLIITPVLVKLKQNNNIFMAVASVLLGACGLYLYNIGFYPPIPSINGSNIVIPIFFALLSVGLYALYQKNSIASKIIVVVFAAFAGLIAIAPPSLTDLMYILAPAYRLQHGFKVSDIYFQYDMLLSYLALACMKSGNSIELIPYIGQITFFLFYVGCFFFADKFFKSKGLSTFFIVALILVRFYSVWSDNPSVFQVTPIRLDLWLILVFVAHKKGIHHWLLGVCLGLLVLFHRNLGLIYLGAYVELLCALFALDIVNLAAEKNLNGKTIGALFVKHLRANGINIGLSIASIALCYILFKEMFSPSALVYRELGIGMLPISKISFYWYAPLIISCLVGLLFFYRNKLEEKYVSIAAFIVLLLIGNSVYFFGRSHENNILNISGILMLAAFVIFDILIFLSPKQQASSATKPTSDTKNKKSTDVTQTKSPLVSRHRLALLLPALMVGLIGFFYSDRISEKTKIQYSNLLESKFSYPFEFFTMDSAAIKQITNNSKKVYFFDFYYDFYFYYYGNYVPQGYFNPCAAWVYKKDLIDLMQDLINKDYYIVMNTRYMGQNLEDYLPYLDYNRSVIKNDMMAISKQNLPSCLPKLPTDVYNIAIADTLPAYSINHAGIKLQDEFTIEVVTKPIGQQRPSATLLTNFSRHDGQKGFILQANGAFPDKFVFGFSNGRAEMPNLVFDMEQNKWHVLAITVTKDNLKVYDNGKLLGTVATGGSPYINSETPIMIGNQKIRDNPYSGFIKSIRMTNGILSETDIMADAQKALSTVGAN